MKNLAIIGRGRLAQSVAAASRDVFNATLLGREDALPRDTHIVIAAIPGNAFVGLIPSLLEIEQPMIVASTGFTWPVETNVMLRTLQRRWIIGANFSLGIQALRRGIETMTQTLWGAGVDMEAAIDETHHEGKQDRPSGTALAMRAWAGAARPIISRRIGTALPKHILSLTGAFETVTVTHETKNYDVYAQGIVWLLEQMRGGYYPRLGLTSFDEVFDAVMAGKKKPDLLGPAS